MLSFSAFHPPSLTHTAAHFPGHLFLRLFQLFQEFASQMWRIPTAPTNASHAALRLWCLNRSLCTHTGLLLLLLLLPLRGSAAVQQHDSRECSPLHFNLHNQRSVLLVGLLWLQLLCCCPHLFYVCFYIFTKDIFVCGDMYL